MAANVWTTIFVLCLDSAVVLAKELNRTLIVPNLLAGGPHSSWEKDNAHVPFRLAACAPNPLTQC
jgi:hypothetical protein